MWLLDAVGPYQELAEDVCLEGVGGVNSNEHFRATFPGN